MTTDSIRRARVARDGAALVATALTVAACASAPVAKPAPYQVGATVGAPPTLPSPQPAPLAAQTSGVDGPPAMDPVQPSIVGMPSTRVNVSARNEDLSAVIERVARQAGLTAVIDPGVHGPVTRTLQNVTMQEAMTSLLGNQFQFQVRNGALLVSPVQLVQRTYAVDYLAASRLSTGSTVVSRGTQGTFNGQNSPLTTGAAGLGTGVANSGGGMIASGADVIQSSSQADVWGELTQQLASIVFGGGADSLNTATMIGGVSGGARPYSRCAGQVCLRISPLTSLVDVTATQEKQEEVSRYLALFNGAISRQVLIKAQVVEVGLNREHTFGIDWQAVINTAKGAINLTSNPNAAFVTDPTSSVTSSGNVSFNLGVGDFTLRAVINALQTVGDVTVVATPTINAMNQQRASFNVTRQEQFFSITRTPIVSPTGTITFSETPTIQTATAGLVFDVLPQISDRNVVLLSIRPSLTSIVDRTTIQNASGVQATLPVTDHRETDTMARVRSGETIMIGGLIQKQTQTTRSGIPILMSLPFLGKVFSSERLVERNSELVIFLTPEIVSGQPPVGR